MKFSHISHAYKIWIQLSMKKNNQYTTPKHKKKK